VAAGFDPIIDPGRLPRHVAIIMDGNGRWAQLHGLGRIEGHKRGKDAVHAVVETARRMGIEVLSLYAFSTENWARPPREVRALMALLRRYLRSELAMMLENGIRLRAVGDLSRLPPTLQQELQATIDRTRDNRDMTVVLAVSYGGREEITRAARALAAEVAAGSLLPEQIDPARLAAHLDTAGLPDPDLLIRTSGEMRVSNFFLWQIAYSEIYITDTLWPDFREAEFVAAIEQYQRRERRFGRTSDQVEKERLRAAR
jgi:undecaprenyl diphosphate synthase